MSFVSKVDCYHRFYIIHMICSSSFVIYQINYNLIFKKGYFSATLFIGLWLELRFFPSFLLDNLRKSFTFIGWSIFDYCEWVGAYWAYSHWHCIIWHCHEGLQPAPWNIDNFLEPPYSKSEFSCGSISKPGNFCCFLYWLNNSRMTKHGKEKYFPRQYPEKSNKRSTVKRAIAFIDKCNYYLYAFNWKVITFLETLVTISWLDTSNPGNSSHCLQVVVFHFHCPICFLLDTGGVETWK